MIVEVQQKIGDAYHQLNRSQKIYLVGCLLALNTLFWYLIPTNDISKVSLFLLISCWVAGITSDCLYVYHKIWRTTLGKAFFIILYALLTNITYGFADQIINQIVEYESSGLNRVTNFVAIMLIPVIFILVTFFLFLIFIFVSQFYVMYVIWAKDRGSFNESYSGWSCAARLLIYPFIFSMLFTFGEQSKDKYANLVAETAQSYIYNFEAKVFSRCVTPKGAKVLTVTNDEIVIVTKINDKYSFSPTLCDPILKK